MKVPGCVPDSEDASSAGLRESKSQKSQKTLHVDDILKLISFKLLAANSKICDSW